MACIVRPPARSSDGYNAARTIGVGAALVSVALCARGIVPWWAFLLIWTLQAECMCRLFDAGVLGKAKPVDGVEDKERAYTWQEVAARNGADAGWVAIDGIVYDVTEFIDKHPGGREMILLALGRDATDLFKSYHPFTDKPWAVLRKHRVGTLATHEHPTYAPDSGFYREARAAVKKYFDETGKDPKGPLAMILRMAPVYVLFAICFYGAFLARDLPTAVRAVLAIVLGCCQGMPLTGWMHDSSHAAIGHNESWWWTIGRGALDYVSGSSMLSWRYQHVVGHHVYTNVMGADPDLPMKIDDDPRRLVDEQKWRSMYRYQHIYLMPLYGVLGIKSRVQDFTEIFSSKTNGPVRVNPISTQDYLRMVCGKAVWAFYRIVVPLAIMKSLPASTFWKLFMATEWTTGYWLAFNFQVSHVSDSAEFLFTDLAGRKHGAPPAQFEKEWAVTQISTSVDYAHGSWWATYLSGALNYQTVHHLFPTVSQAHYPAITPIVMEVARKHGIKFNVRPSFASALLGHVKHLRDMGRQGVAAELKLE